MKTYTKRVTESTTVIGGIDQFGQKGDLLQVTEECNSGQTFFRVFFLGGRSEGDPIKTFLDENEAIEECRREIRNINTPIQNLQIRKIRFDVL